MTIHKRMIAIMREIGGISKDSKAPTYKYRSAEDVLNRAHVLMAKHGVFMLGRVIEHKVTEREVEGRNGPQLLVRSSGVVEWFFVADDGSSVSTQIASQGVDYQGDKGSNKLMTVTQRQAVCHTFLVPTKDVVIDSEDPAHDASDYSNEQPRNVVSMPSSQPAPKPEPRQQSPSAIESPTQSRQAVEPSTQPRQAVEATVQPRQQPPQPRQEYDPVPPAAHTDWIPAHGPRPGDRPPAPGQVTRSPDDAMTVAQFNAFKALWRQSGIPADTMKAMIKGYGYHQARDIRQKDYRAIMKEMKDEMDLRKLEDASYAEYLQ